MSAAKKQKKEESKDVKTEYTPKNILVTGGAGFIASHIVIQLVKQFPHYKVVCFDKMDYCSSLANLNEVMSEKNFKFIKGNLLSADLLKYVFETEQIDTIIHAAAQTHVDNSFGNSFAFTENNVMGTHVIVETAKTHGIKRFIHVSTDEVYGSSYEEDPRRVETDVLEPTNPYAATKAAAENIVKSYYRSFKLPVIITRGNNVYGPHQYPEKVIPKFVRRLLTGLPCCIHGDGSNSRHFIYVEDVARAFLTILHKGVDGETYNIGCEDEYTNLEVAQKLVKTLNPTLADPNDKIEFVEDRPFNDVRYYISSTKLHGLGWAPEVNFEDGLQRTVDWYAKVSPDWWEEEEAAAEEGGESAQGHAHLLSGRLTAIEQVTLIDSYKEGAGIHKDAQFFAYAYPLNAFSCFKAEPNSLNLDLELELHGELERMRRELSDADDFPKSGRAPPSICPCRARGCTSTSPCERCSRRAALRFLAVGGFLYFDIEYKLVQVTTLQQQPRGKPGLSFNHERILRSGPFSDEQYKKMDALNQQWEADEIVETSDGRLVVKDVGEEVNRILLEEARRVRIAEAVGKRLLDRGDMCPVTMPIAGTHVKRFCWLTPEEVLNGVRELTMNILPSAPATPSDTAAAAAAGGRRTTVGTRMSLIEQQQRSRQLTGGSIRRPNPSHLGVTGREASKSMGGAASMGRKTRDHSKSMPQPPQEQKQVFDVSSVKQMEQRAESVLTHHKKMPAEHAKEYWGDGAFVFLLEEAVETPVASGGGDGARGGSGEDAPRRIEVKQHFCIFAVKTEEGYKISGQQKLADVVVKIMARKIQRFWRKVKNLPPPLRPTVLSAIGSRLVLPSYAAQQDTEQERGSLDERLRSLSG